MMPSPSPPPPPKKKRRAPWPWIILVAAAGIIVLFIAISSIVNSQRNGTTGLTQTPAPDLTTAQGIEQYARQLAQHSGAIGTDISTQYNPKANGILITETLDIQSGASSTKTFIENDCFAIQRSIWMSSMSLAVVEVHILGLVTDGQGNTSTQTYGACGLKEKTEQTFNWDRLTYNQAWNHYDATWMQPSLNP